MELCIYNSQNKLYVHDRIFDCKFNEALIHQITVAYQAKSRQGTHSQKNRAAVAGSGKKPWRQKGTGRARAGSFQSPIWRSGGVTFAARMQDYTQKVNKKMYRIAMKSILSELIRQQRLIVVDKLFIAVPKTNMLLKKINTMSLKKVLIIIDKFDKNLFLAARNLHYVKVLTTNYINPISLIVFDKTVITINAIKQIEEMFL